MLKLVLVTMSVPLTSIALAQPAGNPCPPGFVGSVKTAVSYVPGPQASKAMEVAPRHFAFLSEQMKKGMIQYAGPMIEGASPTGKALAIYNSTDLKAVEDVVKADPMVSEKVLNYATSNWMQCELPPKNQKGDKKGSKAAAQ